MLFGRVPFFFLFFLNLGGTFLHAEDHLSEKNRPVSLQEPEASEKLFSSEYHRLKTIIIKGRQISQNAETDDEIISLIEALSIEEREALERIVKSKTRQMVSNIFYRETLLIIREALEEFRTNSSASLDSLRNRKKAIQDKLNQASLDFPLIVGLSKELGGGNSYSYLDKISLLNNNPDATYLQKVHGNWARPLGSAATLVRESFGLSLDLFQALFD